MHPEIENESELRAQYPATMERARLKTLRKLDRHCRHFIGLSPFLCLGTASDRGVDVSPRGDRPGFVHVLDDMTIAIPDWPGNNRLDSLANVASDPRVGVLFLVPGVDESLRVNGAARITTDADLLSGWETNGKQPRSALVVTVHEAFFHCGKALLRSRLWTGDYRVDRAQLPSYGAIMKDQIEIDQSAEEIDASINDGYRNRLY